MDRILNMVVNMFVRKLMSKGMDAGIDMVTRKRGNTPDQPDVADPAAAKRAKDTMKITRRMTKF